MTWLITWWKSLTQDRREKIVYEFKSVIETFAAAFIIQMAVDVDASKFVIGFNLAVLLSLATAALKAGIKAVFNLLVEWARKRYG